MDAKDWSDALKDPYRVTWAINQPGTIADAIDALISERDRLSEECDAQCETINEMGTRIAQLQAELTECHDRWNGHARELGVDLPYPPKGVEE